MVTEYMLTTIDNPYSPFTQFDEWLEFDTLKGYNTCGYLARVAKTSSSSFTSASSSVNKPVKESICRVRVS